MLFVKYRKYATPRDECGHGVGESDPGEDAGDDGGGAEHPRRRRVTRLHRSAKASILSARFSMILYEYLKLKGPCEEATQHSLTAGLRTFVPSLSFAIVLAYKKGVA